jgi:hypothetical protein
VKEDSLAFEVSVSWARAIYIVSVSKDVGRGAETHFTCWHFNDSSGPASELVSCAGSNASCVATRC